MVKMINTIVTLFISNVLIVVLFVLWILAFYFIKSRKFNKNEDLITNYLIDNIKKVISFCFYSFIVIYFGIFFVTRIFCKNLNINYSETIFIAYYILNLITAIYQCLKNKEKLIQKYKENLSKKVP